MRKFFLGTILIGMLAGCAVPQIYHGQLTALDKGMAPNEVVHIFNQAPIAIHRASAGDRSFELYQYRMNNGVQIDSYLLAFESGKLIYWGYPDEFRRQADAGLSKAVSSVLLAIYKTSTVR